MSYMKYMRNLKFSWLTRRLRIAGVRPGGSTGGGGNSPAPDLWSIRQPAQLETINQIHFNTSTMYPTQATWTEPSLTSIRIQNPASSPVSLWVGYGTDGSYNHTTEPNEVKPGQEFVGLNNKKTPIFCRADPAATGDIVATVISTRKAV